MVNIQTVEAQGNFFPKHRWAASAFLWHFDNATACIFHVSNSTGAPMKNISIYDNISAGHLLVTTTNAAGFANFTYDYDRNTANISIPDLNLSFHITIPPQPTNSTTEIIFVDIVGKDYATIDFGQAKFPSDKKIIILKIVNNNKEISNANITAGGSKYLVAYGFSVVMVNSSFSGSLSLGYNGKNYTINTTSTRSIDNYYQYIYVDIGETSEAAGGSINTVTFQISQNTCLLIFILFIVLIAVYAIESGKRNSKRGRKR